MRSELNLRLASRLLQFFMLTLIVCDLSVRNVSIMIDPRFVPTLKDNRCEYVFSRVQQDSVKAIEYR